MPRKSVYRGVLIVCALVGALSVYGARAAVVTHTVTFDAGGYDNYRVVYGSVAAVGRTGNGILAQVGDHPNKRWAGVELLVNCASGTITVSHWVRFDTGNFNDYLGTSVSLYDVNNNSVAHHDHGYQMRTPNIWLAFSKTFSVGTGVTRIYVSASYWENNPLYIHMDDVSVQCEWDSAPEFASDPEPDGLISIGPGAYVGGELRVDDALRVWNEGTDTLHVSQLQLSGLHADSFTVNTAPFSIGVPQGDPLDGAVDVSITCHPRSYGTHVATMTLTTNDSGRPSPSYTLTCWAALPEEGWDYPFRYHDRDEWDGAMPAVQPFPGFGGDEVVSWDIAWDANIVLSRNQGAPVFAAYSGVVVNVERMEPGCQRQLAHFHLGGLNGYCWINEWLYDGINERWVWMEVAYIVDIELEDSRVLRYLVDAPVVEEGQPVAKGCQIGSSLSAQYGNPLTGYVRHGYTLVRLLAEDLAIDLGPKLTHEPAGTVCGVRTGSACDLVRNSTFQGGREWSLEPGADGRYPGFELDGDGLVPVGVTRQTLALDPARWYSISVYHRGMHDMSGYRFTVQLGSNDPIVIEHGSRVTEIAPAQYSPTFLSLYDLVISDQWNGASAVIDFICVYDSEDIPPLTPGGCIVYNPDMEPHDAWRWIAPPGVVISGGSAVLPDGAYIRQPVVLHTGFGAPLDYTIQVRARMVGVPAAGAAVTLSWSYARGEQTAGEGEWDELVSRQWIDLEGELVIAEMTDLDLTIFAEGTRSAEIDRVCIVPAAGGGPPGYRPPPPVVVQCRTCVYTPVGSLDTDFSEYVGWLGCMLSQLFECQFKTVLVGILSAVTNILVFLGFARMWAAGVMIAVVTWANGNIVVFAAYQNRLIWNLGTTVENALVTVRSFTLVTSSGAGFWDVLVALFEMIRGVFSEIGGFLGSVIGLLQRIVDGLFALAPLLLTLIGSVIQAISNIVTGFMANAAAIIMGVIQALINGLNMAPVDDLPDWVPVCDGGNMTGVCAGVVLLENELQRDLARYLVPLVFGLAILNQIMWAAERLVEALSGGGGSSAE